MLFNSFQFLLVFLPATLAGFYAIARFGHRSALAWLALMSLVFYAWSDVSNLPILLVSVAWNFIFGRAICKSTSRAQSQTILFFGVGGNILALIFYKYLNLFVSALGVFPVFTIRLDPITLPLGISFFTFTQIAFLVDAHKRKVNDPHFTSYLLFVSYFPHLIAGPIIHHKDVIPQFERKAMLSASTTNFSLGFSIFTVGLIKKVLLADSIAPHATAVFESAKLGPLTFYEAWLGALSYTMQLYFDFSGYSDMAVGLSLLFGVWLPFNFNSPYKSTSIVDFWRRWHITLSQFLRDYLYIPLGGSRHGNIRRYANLMITMALGGFWHGANWTFLFWGVLHGAYLIANHAVRALLSNLGFTTRTWWSDLAGWFITFVAVVFAWVLFKADSLPQAFGMWRSMADFGSALSSAGQTTFPHLKVGVGYLVVIPLMLIAFFGPNTQTIFRDDQARMNCPDDHVDHGSRVRWQPTLVWAGAFGLAFVVGLLSLFNVSEFIYFNF